MRKNTILVTDKYYFNYFGKYVRKKTTLKIYQTYDCISKTDVTEQKAMTRKLLSKCIVANIENKNCFSLFSTM